MPLCGRPLLWLLCFFAHARDMPVGFHNLGVPDFVAAKLVHHQFREFVPRCQYLVPEDVSDISVTACARRKLVVHGVAAGTANKNP